MLYLDFDVQLNAPSPERGIRLRVELDVDVAATQALYPDVLGVGEIICLVNRRNVAIPEVDCGVVKLLMFM